MSWPLVAYLADSVSPLDSATGSLVGYLLGYGPLGLATVLLVALYVWPGHALKRARDEARADLVAEIERLSADWARTEQRLVADRERAEAQRDKLAARQEEIVPLLGSFVSTTQNLIPILQDMVRYRDFMLRERDHGH